MVNVTPDCTITLVVALVLVRRIQLVLIIHFPVVGGGVHGLMII